MKLKLTSIGLSLAVAAALDVSTLSGDAQDVLVTGTLTDVQGAGSTFDYTLTLDNTGTEAVQSLWVGWVPGSFNIDAPTSVGNNLGWSSTVDGNSIQFGGTAGSALAAGQSGTFTFDSTTTPAQIESLTDKAGESTVYGVNDPDQFDLSLSGEALNTETFDLQVEAAPEPSAFALLAAGFAGFLFVLRRKPSFASSQHGSRD